MNDEESIKNAGLNYVQGWYEADQERMKKALHPELVKRRFVSNEEIWAVTYDWMLNATKDGTGRIDDPKEGKFNLTILDLNENIASVKIISEKFIDYLHLIKINQNWKIFNVLWDYI